MLDRLCIKVVCDSCGRIFFRKVKKPAHENTVPVCRRVYDRGCDFCGKGCITVLTVRRINCA